MGKMKARHAKTSLRMRWTAKTVKNFDFTFLYQILTKKGYDIIGIEINWDQKVDLDRPWSMGWIKH